MTEIQIVKLTADHRAAARVLFTAMADIFGEQHSDLDDDYLDLLLRNEAFWAIAAFASENVVAGLTAYTLPMTRGEFAGLLIYDIAVGQHYRRRGIGRRLVASLRELATAAGIREIFVLADNADVHALDFYRVLGGKPSPVTLFSFEPLERSS